MEQIYFHIFSNLHKDEYCQQYCTVQYATATMNMANPRIWIDFEVPETMLIDFDFDFDGHDSI